MDKNKVLDKIKKCLALSKSANEHEAARALKQAQSLMEKYQVTDNDVVLSEIRNEAADRHMAARLSPWQWDVAHMIADVFGCQKYKRGNAIHFYGFGSRPQIAAYAFDVVYRQITAARRHYLRELCENTHPKHREYLANRFCDGWLQGAREVVKNFALSDQEKALMQRYAENTLRIRTVTPKSLRVGVKIANHGFEVEQFGIEAGKQVQLHQAMNGADGVKQLAVV